MPAKKKTNKKGGKKKKKKAKKIVEDPAVVRALYAAASKGNVKQLNTLLEVTNPKDRNYDMKNKAGLAVVKAAEFGKLNALKTVLNYGGQIDYQNGKPLQKAAKNNQMEVLQFLLENNASLKLKDEFSEMSPLHYAARAGHFAVVETLLRAGLKVNDTVSDRNCGHSNGWAALHFAADAGHLEIVKLLVRYDAKMDMKSTDDDTPLGVAAESGRFEIVQWLVNEGADLHVRRRGLSATQWAIYRCEPDVTQFLVSCGGKPDLNHKVIWFENEETLQERLQREFDPKLWKRIDLAVYRGQRELRVRAALYRELNALQWLTQDANQQDSVNAEPVLAHFPSSVIQTVLAFAGVRSVEEDQKKAEKAAHLQSLLNDPGVPDA